MIGRSSRASRFNIYKFSEVLGLRVMEKVVSKRDEFVVDALLYFEPVQRFEYRVICSVLRVTVTARARAFCSNCKRDICFFAVSLHKVNYNSLV